MSGNNLNNANSVNNFQLVLTPEGLTLVSPENKKLLIDFVNNKSDYMRTHQGKSELLAKALGINKGYSSVLDLSAGLAMDAIFIAQIGFDVVSLERNKFLYELLIDAQKRATEFYSKNTFNEGTLVKRVLEAVKRVQFKNIEAIEYIKELTSETDKKPDVIYFDPMYPHKKKSALPRQEMLIFRELVGDDVDASEVLRLALNCARERVVVKRPIKAEPLLSESEIRVTHAFEGKSVRYDMYQVK